MTGKRAIIVITSMAILSIIGLIGMLVAEGGWDVCFFLLAILPLVVGAVGLWHRSSAR
ncbi:hypothetical protein [Stenotrophomonas sp. Iso1]|uniref:hypothetical protein n=1 Tax=Stenotrophomonas sp. Iso1 TaxID=2977283 RepID=UPI0022B770D0|nr:hypothetical protein [Stenotrophomonas sp. Iso1]